MPSGTWILTGSNGNWSSAANWSGTTIADGATFTANFTANITANRTVTCDTNRTIGNLVFSDNGALGSQYTLASGVGTSLSLDNGASKPTINTITNVVISGSLSGTNGFSYSTSNSAYLILSSLSTNLLGDIDCTGASSFVLGSANLPPSSTGNLLPNVSTINLTVSGAQYQIRSNLAFTLPHNIAGVGNTAFAVTASGGLTIPSAKTSGFTGYMGSYADSFNSYINIETLYKLIFYPYGTNSNTRITYSGSTPTTSLDTTIINCNASSSGGISYFIHNGSDGAVITHSNNITGSGSAVATTFELSGSNSNDNIVSGVISNGTLSSLAINKSGIGKWIFSGANTYTGNTSISSGTLSAQNNSAFGSSSSGTVSQSGGTIDVSGGIVLNKGSLGWTLISASGATSLKTSSGTNLITCGGVTLSSTIIVDADSGASLTINNSAPMSGSTFGITKIGAGEFALNDTALNAANTYTGPVTISAGTLTVSILQNTNTASSLGTGAGTSAIALTGTLKYVGTGHSTSRSITFTGSSPSLDASGSGAVTYSACTQATGARTITFTGTSTAANTFSAALSDGTGVVSIAKSGAGKWILSSATLNYTGVTTVNAGTLNLNEVTRNLVDGIVINGGTLENGTAVVTANGASSISGGIITAVLGGSATFTVTTGATASSPAIFQPASANCNNSLTGSVIVNGEVNLITSDALELSSGGNGMVLGSGSTVTVSSTGVIKTKQSTSSIQRGRARYKNLTFQSGSVLKLGYT